VGHPALDPSPDVERGAVSASDDAGTTGNIAAQLLGQGADEAPALWMGERRVNFAELRSAVDKLAGRLAAAQAQGARVGLIAENGPFFVAAYLATIRAGLCVVPIPTAVQHDWLTRVIADTDMALVLASQRAARDEDLLAVQTEAGFELWPEDEDDPLGVAVSDDAAGGAADGAPDSPDDPAGLDRPIDPATDLAALFFTSGSTGEPKGVMISHRNIEANLAAGASVVFNNGFMFPEKVLDDMVAQECTGFAGVPSHFQILVRKTHFPERDFPHLRWLQQAGGKLPDPFIREIRASQPDVELFIMYGQTEATARLSYLPPGRLDDKLGSIGRGLASTILEVLDEDGNPVAPGSGNVGEIVATGDNVALGYWRDPEGTDRYFHGGKLHTRDLATVDEEGFIFIVDRARDFIKSMGNRISPKEVEDVIAELPEIVEVAVIGVPDDIWGEAVKAVVVLASPQALSAKEIIRHCNERLPNYKVPSQTQVVSSLPKNESGKVLKAELRRQAADAERAAGAEEAAGARESSDDH